MGTGRKILNLNCCWKFSRHDDPRSWYKGFDDSSWQDVFIPHDWSVREKFSRKYSSGTGYTAGGTGWYRKHFLLPAEARTKKVFISFGGIYNHSQIWINSNYLGKRPYGYSSFTYDISDFCCFGCEENLVSVKVNHNDIADSRWFTGSGIYRDVKLAITEKIYIPEYGVFISCSSCNEKKALINIQTEVSNESGRLDTYKVSQKLLDEKRTVCAQTSGPLECSPGKTESLIQQLELKKPELWSPDTPNLYTLQTQVFHNGKMADCIETSTGLRTFEFDAERGFFLNGQSMKIRGVCIHHDAGCLGAAVPARVWERRLQLLKEMGCNAVRMSHNPPDPILLDLCDRMGFLVIDEAFDEWEGVKNKWFAGHNVYPPKHFGYAEDFPVWHEKDLKAMVSRDRNHPCVILWSIGNEVDYPNDPYCHPLFKTMTGNNDANKPPAEREYDPDKPNAVRLTSISAKLVSIVKQCDSTRPVTAAIAFPELSNLTGYTDTLDIVGYNYKEHLYRQDHKKYPERVLYGSENGPGLNQWLSVKNNEYISAQFIWTGIDYLGEAEGWPVRASRSGFLDLAGFPRPCYYFRQSLWSGIPMIYAAARKKNSMGNTVSSRWLGDEPHWNWKNGDSLEVICYTNCPQAEMFLNGISLGRKSAADFPDGYMIWETDFVPGCLSAAGFDGKTELCSREMNSAGAPQNLVLTADRDKVPAGCPEIIHLEIGQTDGAGIPVYKSNPMITVTTEGPGQLLGLENGDAADPEPYSSGRRKLFNGRLLAYIRTTGEAGEITVTAKKNGLPDAEKRIRVE